MYRSLLPFILASLGSTLFAWAISMPLFEWHISEIVTDNPYEVQFTASPWVTKFGESLEDRSYIIHQVDGRYCKNDRGPEELNSVVSRSWTESVLEQITRKINRSIIPWLWLLIFLSGAYFWWYSINYKHPIAQTFIFIIVAGLFLCVLLYASRPFFAVTVGLGCLEGSITFNANLSKVYYGTFLVFFTAIIAVVGSLGVIVRQVIKATTNRNNTLSWSQYMLKSEKL